MASANATEHPGGLRARRLAAGLTQQQVATLADCSLSYVRMLEAGYQPTAGGAVRQRILAALSPVNDDAPAGEGGRVGTTSAVAGGGDGQRV